jgi:hypothetical protein
MWPTRKEEGDDEGTAKLGESLGAGREFQENGEEKGEALLRISSHSDAIQRVGSGSRRAQEGISLRRSVPGGDKGCGEGR